VTKGSGFGKTKNNGVTCAGGGGVCCNCSYLGYPSTSGGLDQLLVSDRMSTPPETRHLYTEKLVFLPHSYFVNDHRQLYPRPFVHIATRIEHGLPEDRVIFGNFGQLYKVEPKLFDVWAQIVKRTPNGTLWALKFPKEAVKRLEQQAKSRGLTSDHMVLSPLLPIDSHLAIKALADVALDTAMFNGHTTGADTLWTGTPLVSLSGEQMRSRAGASMAYSLGVTDFLARSLQDYQALALRLAASRRRLRRARQRLERALVTSPFFDTALWAKGFERSWFLMWDALIASSSVDSKHLVTSGQNLKIDPADLVPLPCPPVPRTQMFALYLPQMRSSCVWPRPGAHVCLILLGADAICSLTLSTEEATGTGGAGGQEPHDRNQSTQAFRHRVVLPGWRWRAGARSSWPILFGSR